MSANYHFFCKKDDDIIYINVYDIHSVIKSDFFALLSTVINHNIWVRFLCRTDYVGKCGKFKLKIPESLDTACFRGVFVPKNFLKNIKKRLAI